MQNSTPLVPLPALRNALYQGDCRQLLRAVPTGEVDLVVTDPPYNIASEHALTRASGRVVTTAEA
jgi:DNA modification methylase